MYWRYTDVARGGFGYNRRLLRRGIQRRRGGHGRVREKVGGRWVGRGWQVEKRAAVRAAAVGRHRDRRRCSIHDVNFARVCGCTLHDRVESNR